MSNNLPPSAKLKIDLICSPAPLLLGIYPDEMKSVCGRDICTDIVALSIAITSMSVKEQMEIQNVVYTQINIT